ncbi:tetratricopeptide repeat protein [uncultured Caulobacter sp.]|uniref:O-linked N-acetylglucosamine transferase, SPINDLY family protein n=1 Tax=uncultured Caulobacter sp. TaxID=158749 RepID=UPI002609F2E2|nr:tetratricopeptide repeat protein [uncultured Caulobacter sp.]
MATAREAFALYRAGRLAEAAALCERLVEVTPTVEAWHLLGVSRLGLNQAQAALDALEAGLALDPRRPGLLSARALALTALDRDDEAVAAARAALAADPDNPPVFNALAVSLRRLGQFEGALAAADRAVLTAPGEAGPSANRAVLLSLLNRPAEAASDWARVIAIDPRHPRAIGDLLWARRQTCDWRDDAELKGRVEAALRSGVLAIAPFAALAVFDDPALHRRCAELAAPPRGPEPVWPVRPAGERIRIAYLSSDFHEHATARLLAGVLEAHDRSRVEVHAVSYGPQTGGPMQARLRAACEHWLDARPLSDAAIAQTCRALGVDIAVDLKGYTQDSRPGILAHHAAPVQVSWLGYPGTLGTHADIVLADSVTLPAGAEADWSETVARLPRYQPNDSLGSVLPPPPSRAEAGLPEGAAVFCCFNNPAKITPEVFAVWMAILRAEPNSVLWLYAGAPGAADNLRVHAGEAGIDPARLIFAEPVPNDRHLARHALADLVLDTWPYGAHTTASDALRMGLPVLTLPGKSFASRVGASLLTALGLTELIAGSEADYVAKALALAGEPGLKRRVSEAVRASTLFDPVAFARSLEAVYARLAPGPKGR